MTPVAPDEMPESSRADDPLFPIASMIRDAEGHARRASLLLRAPDAVMVGHGAAIQDACTAAGFITGAAYVLVRSSLLNAMRDEAGNMPAYYAQQAEFWRRGMVAIAGGGHV